VEINKAALPVQQKRGLLVAYRAHVTPREIVLTERTASFSGIEFIMFIA
jgi:hypothetical protein